jgi:predicted dehydrogenase
MPAINNVTKARSRREFLKRSLAAGGVLALPAIIPASVLGRDGAVAPGGRIALGVIGIGPRMSYDLGGVLPHADVRCVAVCDVQANHRADGKRIIDGHYGNTDCAVYRDFRELLGRSDIDAVLIGTGDRWHAMATILAAKAGKDVYSEKPCGLTIGLCQALDDTIRQTKRVFQAGTQRRSLANFQAAVRLAQSGKLGKIHTLVASVYTPKIETAWLPAEPTPPRDVVDWDLWLGPAPWRPYNHAYVEGQWRGQWDFESGARLLDWGVHTVDLCQWANTADDTMPVEYEPVGNTIVARYANGVKLVLDCLETPFGQRPGWIQATGACPVRFEGEDGWVETGDSGRIEVHPASLKAEVEGATRPRQADVKVKGGGEKRHPGFDVAAHVRNFIDCVKTRGAPLANSHVMRHSHIACHAAALSWILQRKLKLDPAKEQFIGDDEANGLRYRPARAPWAV